MAWTELTRADLTTALSAAELEAFSGSAGFVDAPDAILAQAAAAVRGFVQAGGRAVPEGAGLVPESLAPFAVDWAAWRLLKRLDIPVGEDRRRAHEAAMEVFRAVAEGRMAVEPPPGGGPDAARPAFAPARPARRLD